MKQLSKSIACVCCFAIAMGFLESAVVIYLRELYYKEGFNFPLKAMPLNIAVVEVLREAATILMLIGIGYLAGKTKLQRFAYFCLAFAVWDLFYYLFLYVFLSWPQSLATWDILFLIPVPWIAPVWAPCLLALLMLVGSLFVIRQCGKDPGYRVASVHWLSLISGAVACILSFTWSYLTSRLNPQSPDQQAACFNATLFLAGILLMGIPVFYNLFMSLKIKPSINR